MNRLGVAIPTLVPSEEQEQILFFEWLQFVTIDGEPLRPYVYAVPNGGHRNRAVAGKLKAAGVTPGVPDISVVGLPAHRSLASRR
jgi:hypothetical protein